MADLRLKYYTNLVHPLLTIGLPFLFIQAIIVSLVGATGLHYGARIFPPFYSVLLILVGVSETVTGNLLYKERIAGILPRLREFIFVVIFGLLFILLLTGDLFAGEITIKRFYVWFPLAFLLIQWFLSYFIHSKLRNREVFLKFFTEKETGREIRAIYQQLMHEGGDALAGMKHVRQLIIGLLVFGFFFLMIIVWPARIPLGGSEYFVIYCFFFFCFAGLSALNGFHESQFIMMDGLVVSREQKSSRFRWFIIGTILVSLIALPLVGRKSLLPESYLADFYEWLHSLGRTERIMPKDVKPPEIVTGETEQNLSDYLGPPTRRLGARKERVDIAKYVGFALLGLLVIGAVIFLLLPLFRRKEGRLDIRQSLHRARESLGKSWEAFWQSIREFFDELKRRRQVKTWDRIKDEARSLGVFPGKPGSGEKVKLTRKERRVRSRYLKAFQKFIKWGERRNVRFSVTIPPLEYALAVRATAPEILGDCRQIAEIFEEVLFSEHVIDTEKSELFFNTISTITKLK